MYKPQVLIVISFMLSMQMACGDKQAGDNPDIVAVAFGKKLYRQDVLDALRGREQTGDSSYLYQEYIQNWVRKQALLNKAMESLSAEEKDKQKELESYRDDLITYEYEKKILRQNLDLEVSDLDILSYYRNNQKNFELKENIVRLIFFKVPKNVRKLERLWNQFVKGKDEDLEKLTRLSIEQGGNFNRDEDKWFSFNEILKEIPITTYNQENYLSNHKNIRTEDEEYIYFVKILAFRIKNNISPFEFEKERIRSILINKRKITLLKQMQRKIVEEAYANNKIEVYYDTEEKSKKGSAE